MIAPPPGFTGRPIAHRGLHDPAAGPPENSIAAITAAVEAGYGVEIDIRPSADGEAIVFHDRELARMTGAEGVIEAQDAAALSTLRLAGSAEAPPPLADALAAVGHRYAVYVEVKSEPDLAASAPALIERFDARIAEQALAHWGPVCIMSFDDERTAAIGRLARELPLGVVTATAEGLVDRVSRLGAAFVSVEQSILSTPEVVELRAGGVTVVTWTIRSPEEAARAADYADQITFEGFRP